MTQDKTNAELYDQLVDCGLENDKLRLKLSKAEEVIKDLIGDLHQDVKESIFRQYFKDKEKT